MTAEEQQMLEDLATRLEKMGVDDRRVVPTGDDPWALARAIRTALGREDRDGDVDADGVVAVAGAAQPDHQAVVRTPEAEGPSGAVVPVAPDSVGWWREVAQRLGVECHILTSRLATVEQERDEEQAVRPPIRWARDHPRRHAARRGDHDGG